MRSLEFPARPLENLPDFVTPHDGSQPEISKTEQQLVGQKFSVLIDNVLLNCADTVRRRSFTLFSKVDSHESLDLRLPIDEVDYWGISILVDTSPEPSTSTQHINKQLTLGKFNQRAYVDYRLLNDGVVYRWTQTNTLATFILSDAEHMIMDGWSADLASDYAQQQEHSATHGALENLKLEQQMGLQLQPIDSSELDGLVDMFSQPDIAVLGRVL